MRLFPVPYRFLDDDKRFHKYQWIDARVRRAVKDARPESHTIDLDSISIGQQLGTDRKWQARKDTVIPLASHCLCCLKRERDAQGFPTLGIFKPAEISALDLEPEESAQWTDEEIEKLTQHHSQGFMFGTPPTRQLEKIPYKFYYRFRCPHAECTGHRLSCTDWEMGASYLSWRRQYGQDWERAFRHKYEYEMLKLNETSFYVGTVHRYPDVWIIVGLFYPRR